MITMIHSGEEVDADILADELGYDVPTSCPACGADLEVEQAEPAVGIFYPAISCVGMDCGWED